MKSNRHDDSVSMMDHDYDRTALREPCDDEDIVEMEEEASKVQKKNTSHTPIKSPNPKKIRKQSDRKDEEDSTSFAILQAVQALSQKMDEQTELLKSFDKRIAANAAAVNENKEDIQELKKKVDELQKENKSLRNASEEQARYKRRWNLRLTGLPEKDGEDTREMVIGILTRVIPLSVDRLRETVDTVHRLGRKDAATHTAPRAIIIQFGMRTIRDDIWRRSRDARVCSELHIRFREDFSKEDREARAKLWPVVQDARRKGQRAFLKEGYAMINNRRVDPE